MTFDEAVAKVIAIHDAKGVDYGTDEDDRANLRASEAFGIPAWVGTLVRANDKMMRLQAFAQRGVLENESVEDSLLDLATYAVLALSLYQVEPVTSGFSQEATTGVSGHYDYNWRRPAGYYKRQGGPVWEQVRRVGPDGEWEPTGETIPRQNTFAEDHPEWPEPGKPGKPSNPCDSDGPNGSCTWCARMQAEVSA